MTTGAQRTAVSNPPVIFWVYLDFFLFPLRSIFVFFELDFFTITGFGDDGSGADGRVIRRFLFGFIWIFFVST